MFKKKKIEFVKLSLIGTADALAILMVVNAINKTRNTKSKVLSDFMSTIICLQNKFNPEDVTLQI